MGERYEEEIDSTYCGVAFILAISFTVFSRTHASPANQQRCCRETRSRIADRRAGPRRADFGGHQDRVGIERQDCARCWSRKETRSTKGRCWRSWKTTITAQRLRRRRRGGPAQEATLRKVVNGARAQERSEALSSAHAAEAVDEQCAVGKRAPRETVCRRSDLPRGDWSAMSASTTWPRRSTRNRWSTIRWSTIMPARKTSRWRKLTCSWPRRNCRTRSEVRKDVDQVSHRRHGAAETSPQWRERFEFLDCSRSNSDGG